MKIIDLLNKIANGEEIPTKIKYGDYIYYLSEYHKDYVSDLSKNVIDTNTYFIIELVNMNNLNDEIEIIEEKPKKIEKIQIDNGHIIDGKTGYILKGAEMILANKINNIIDYLLEKESDK